MDWDIWSKFGMPIVLDLPKCQTWPNQKPEVDLPGYGRHLVKSIWRHSSVGDHPICIKFGRPVQNHMSMTVKRSKSKPEVEFQYSGRLFLEIVISQPRIELSWRNLAWKYFRTFLNAIRQSSPKLKPELDLQSCCRHLQRSTRRHNSITYRLIRIKFIGQWRITCDDDIRAEIETESIIPHCGHLVWKSDFYHRSKERSLWTWLNTHCCGWSIRFVVFR